MALIDSRVAVVERRTVVYDGHGSGGDCSKDNESPTMMIDIFELPQGNSVGPVFGWLVLVEVEAVVVVY